MRLLNSPKLFDFPGVQYVPADPEIYKVTLRDKHFLFDPNSLALFETTKEIFDAIDCSTIGASEKPFIHADCRDMPSKMLVLQTTYACNLKCRYCFVRHHYLSESNMLSLSDAVRALELYQSPQFRPGTGKLEVSFFGGEPLLNWELIYRVTEFQKERAAKAKIPWHHHITTNATLVTEEIAEYCVSNDFSFIVSLDGPAEVHDQNRPYHKGTGSHADTMRGLKCLAEAYHQKGIKSPPITIRATFDKIGLDLVAVLKYLNELMYQGLGSHVSVESSSLGEGCVTDQTRLETLNAEEIRAAFEQEYWKAADWFLAEVRAGKHPSFHHFEMMLQRLYDRQVAFTECGAGKGYLSVGPGGKLSACHRENSAEIGDLQNGVDPTKQAKWLDNRYFVRTKCNECWLRNLCGGGCRHDSLQAKQPIAEPIAVECLFHEMYTRPVLWLLSEMTREQKESYSVQKRQRLQPPPAFSQTQAPQSTQETGLPNQQRLINTPCDDPACPCHQRR